MTSTTTQLQRSASGMSTTLEDEVIYLSPHFSSNEPEFHDAPEDYPEPRLSMFDRLPASFQELLLISVDPETFASLSVLNRHWRRRTNTVLLYSYHLAKCTASSAEQQKQRWSEYNQQTLKALKTMFAREAKRNLFSVYQHSHTTFRIFSPATVSASAVPHGEAFSYAFSSRGSKLAVSSSSRIFLFDLSAATPTIIAAFALYRRPTAVEISEDGRTLVMLAPEWRINTYNIHRQQAQLIQTYLLDEPATTLALSPDGSLAAVGMHSHGLELLALDEMPGMTRRRKLACETVNHLRFADNGSFLLGSNVRSAEGTTTIVNGPSQIHTTFDENEDTPTTAQIWLSQPLFPSSFGRTTHASQVPSEDSCIFAYDSPAETYGMLDFQMMKFVNSVIKAGADVVGTAAGAPSVTSDACLVALPVSGRGVQIASLPLERFATSRQRTPSAPPLYRTQGQGDIMSKYHQRWAALSEKGLSAQWTLLRDRGGAPLKQRLTVVGSDDANGKSRQSAPEESKDSGVIHFLDFGFSLADVDHQEAYTDLSTIPVVALEEGSTADDTEQALARKSLGSRASDHPRNAPLARSVTSAKKGEEHRRRSIEKGMPPAGDDAVDSISPEERHLDAPYHPSDPRPQGTLQRQRTAAQARQARPRSMPMDPRPHMRDPRGRGEIPDESDADLWVPPPPEYAKETDHELPEELRQMLNPPRIPARSPARTSPTPKSASTPNLILNPSQENVSHSVSASGGPVPQARPRPPRVRTMFNNARNSILGMPGMRRASSGPLDSLQGNQSKKPESTSTTTPKESTESPPSGVDPPQAQPRQPNPRRRTLLDRPLSVYTQFRPSNNRSVSQPLERLSTPPFATTPSVPQADSPTIPSPAEKMASLHRRQTSGNGSVSSIRSDFSGAPRAAIGAHRRGTNTMPSPWASSLMLNAVDEEGAGPSQSRSRPVSSFINGSYGSSGYGRTMSLNMNGPGPSGGYSPIQPRKEQQESGKENRPPTRLQEESRENSRSSYSRPNTEETQLRRRSFMPGSRLTSIPSVGSLLSAAKGGRNSSKSPARSLQRNGSKRLDRNGSVKKTSANPGEKEGFKSKFGRWRKAALKNLSSV